MFHEGVPIVLYLRKYNFCIHVHVHASIGFLEVYVFCDSTKFEGVLGGGGGGRIDIIP